MIIIINGRENRFSVTKMNYTHLTFKLIKGNLAKDQLKTIESFFNLIYNKFS